MKNKLNNSKLEELSMRKRVEDLSQSEEGSFSTLDLSVERLWFARNGLR